MSWICAAFGHSFKPRYDKAPPQLPAGVTKACVQSIEACRAVTYRMDVCERCGKITNQQPK